MHLCFTNLENCECKKSDILFKTIPGIKGKGFHTLSPRGCKNVIKVECFMELIIFLPQHTVIFQMQAKMKHTIMVN